VSLRSALGDSSEVKLVNPPAVLTPNASADKLTIHKPVLPEQHNHMSEVFPVSNHETSCGAWLTERSWLIWALKESRMSDRDKSSQSAEWHVKAIWRATRFFNNQWQVSRV